jgi:quinol monooxygenase YgiN
MTAMHDQRCAFHAIADRAALTAHFAVPESRAFVQAMAAIAAEPPSMKVYDAAVVPR